MGDVQILLWWVPPVVVTAVAMLWVGWLGRARDVSPDRSEAAQERFAAAILRDLPAGATGQVGAPRPVRERSTGIAVRPSQAARVDAARPAEAHAVAGTAEAEAELQAGFEPRRAEVDAEHGSGRDARRTA